MIERTTREGIGYAPMGRILAERRVEICTPDPDCVKRWLSECRGWKVTNVTRSPRSDHRNRIIPIYVFTIR